jgi:rubrerythrin
MSNDVSPEVLEYLSSGIKAEIAAYVFYKKSADKLDRDEIKDALRGFANEERKHFLSLEKIYDKHVRSEKWVTYRDTLKQDGLPEIDEQIGDKHVARLARMAAAKTNLDVLNIALELEQEAFKLYSEAKTKSADLEVKELFEFLSKFEQGHVQFVQELIAKETGEKT